MPDHVPALPTDKPEKTDIILPMSRSPTEDWLSRIILRQKTYEFRKVLYPNTVRRIWFYETAPISSIRYICDVGRPVIRPSQPPTTPLSAPTRLLPEDGSVGNKEYNAYAKEYEGYDYAYPILRCWMLMEPISLGEMRDNYGYKGGAERYGLCKRGYEGGGKPEGSNKGMVKKDNDLSDTGRVSQFHQVHHR